MKVTKLYADAILPTRKHKSDAGLDLYAIKDVRVFPNSFEIISTGIAIELPAMFFGLVKPKSKNNHLIGAGVVDSEYRGEILVKLANTTNHDLYIKRGDGIAQLVLIPYYSPEVEEVPLSEFNVKTERGESGGITTEYKTATFITKLENEGLDLLDNSYPLTKE
jgi:dUTP pyrophosphatase